MRIVTRVLNLSIIGLATTRAIAYSSLLGGPYDGAGPQVLSDHGEWLWLYVTLWALTAAVTAVEMAVGTCKISVMFAVFMCFSWGLGYLAAWSVSDYSSPDWMTAALYMSFGLVFVAVKRLVDLLEKLYAQAFTGAIRKVG